MTRHHRQPPRDIVVFESTEELARVFCTQRGLTSNDVWQPYPRREQGEVWKDFVFWLEDGMWRLLCNYVRNMPSDKINAIAARADMDDEITRNTLTRLQQDGITNVHRAAAAVSAAIPVHLSKPFANPHTPVPS